MNGSLPDINFQVPPGFQDVTDYSFTAESKGEELSMTSDQLPPGVRTVDEAMRDRRSKLELKAEDRVRIREEQTGVLAGKPSRELALSFDDDGNPFNEWWAVAILEPGYYSQLSYTAPAGDKEAGNRFRHIVGTATLDAQMAHPAAAPGYVRRRAQILSLDVPADLPPPSTYRLRSQDDQAYLEVTLYQPQESAPTVKELMNRDAADGGTLSDHTSEEVVVQQKRSVIERYIVTENELTGPVVRAFRRGQVRFPDGASVDLMGKATVEASASLEKGFATLLATLQYPR